ncbi:MAG: hypothetical protein WDN04_08685 [Rhodospirillales bacterium]
MTLQLNTLETTRFFALFALIAAPLALAAGPATAAPGTPAGHKQALVAHPSHAAPRSLLPPAALIGNPRTRLLKTYGGTPIDVTAYHYDGGRTGWNQTETDLTPTSVASANFGLLATLNVDGNVFAQPLLVSNFKMPDGKKHDVLIVVTGHDSVYAFDAQTYAVLWQVSLGTSQSSNDVGCGDVEPEYGISGTPVIVRNSAKKATIYLVAATEPTPFEFHSQLYALDLATGTSTVPPVEIAPSGKLNDGSPIQFDPQNQWNRAGLAYENGSIYIGVGSHCDNGINSTTGWLLRYNTKLVLKHAFHTIGSPTSYRLASIWMTGFAPAIGPDGDLFVVTGNGDFQQHNKDLGESVLRLPPSLATVKDRFTVASYSTLNGRDQDFGSGGVMLLPQVAGQTAPPMAVAMGKASILYLLNQDNLGGLKANDAGALQWQSGGGGGVWGGPAYFNGPGGPTVFTQASGDVLRGWAVATGATPSLTNTLNGSITAGFGGSMPIVSSNGATPHTGVVWLERRTKPIELEAYDAEALGSPIYVADAGTWGNPNENNPFVTPLQANGRVYVTAYLTVKVFGLTP